MSGRWPNNVMMYGAPMPDPVPDDLSPFVPLVPPFDPTRTVLPTPREPGPTRTEFLQAIESLRACVRDEVASLPIEGLRLFLQSLDKRLAAVESMLAPLTKPVVHVEPERVTVGYRVKVRFSSGQWHYISNRLDSWTNATAEAQTFKDEAAADRCFSSHWKCNGWEHRLVRVTKAARAAGGE